MMFQMKPFLAILGFALSPSYGLAQSAQVTGNLDGETLDFSMSGTVGGMPPLFLETYTDGGTSELEIIAGAIVETEGGLDGVMLFLGLETDDASQSIEPTSDMAYFAEAMIVDEWAPGAPFPETVWMAELDRFAVFEIDTLSIEGDAGTLTGRITSDRFCLHSFSGDEPVAVRRDGAMICKPGAVNFAMSSDGATVPPPPSPMEVEVLGRATGMIGYDSYEWITFLPAGAEPTATIDQIGGLELLRIQAHNPASGDFLRDDVLTVTVAADPATGEIPSRGMVPVELSFFTGEQGSHYTSQVDSAGVTADILSFYVDGDMGEIDMVLDGRICLVEGLETVPDDCKAFEAQIATEIFRTSGD